MFLTLSILVNNVLILRSFCDNPYRDNLKQHVSHQEERTTRHVFQEWKVRWLQRRAVRSGLERWSTHCLQRAVDRWKGHVTRIRQERKADEFSRQSARNLIKSKCLNIWLFSSTFKIVFV